MQKSADPIILKVQDVQVLKRIVGSSNATDQFLIQPYGGRLCLAANVQRLDRPSCRVGGQPVTIDARELRAQALL